jgi:hypothetical protein
MDKIIKKAESIDLTGKDIMNITNGQVNIYEYKELARYSNIDDLLHTFGACIILYETSQSFGHWVLLHKVSPNTLEFFDPYGMQIDEELKYISEHARNILGEDVAHLTHLIGQSSYYVIVNDHRLQSIKSYINTCGRHVSVRLRFRNLNLKQYINLFKNSKLDPDEWVSALTILYSI